MLAERRSARATSRPLSRAPTANPGPRHTTAMLQRMVPRLRPTSRALVLLACVVLCAVVLAALPDSAWAKGEEPVRLLLIAPSDGADGAVADEHERGVRAALAARRSPKQVVEVERVALPDTERDLVALLKKRRKELAFVLASLPDGRVVGIEDACDDAKLPLLVLSREPTRPDLGSKAGVFWAGGIRPADEAQAAMDFALLPLTSRFPVLLHDGSERAQEVARRCAALRHVSQTPSVPREIPLDLGPEQAAELAAAGGDSFVYFGGPERAELLLRAHVAAELELPILLGQGLASAAVPSFHQGTNEHAWCIEPVFFEDRGGPATDLDLQLGDAAREAGTRPVPNALRAARATSWLLQALDQASPKKLDKTLVPALRALEHAAASGKPKFEWWGHASLPRTEPWRASATKDSPACHRVRDTLMPMAGIPQIGCFDATRFAPTEEQLRGRTQYVHLTWGDDEERTIEKDLADLGLASGGYEADLERRIKEDLMGRVISKLNYLYQRNVDGTAIPGVSYDIVFTTEPPPDEVKGSRVWNVLIRGDDPIAGGRAQGNQAWVFPSYMVRTMYGERAIEPALNAKDRPYLVGTYRWHTSLDENLRGDRIRALLDGFSQALALTTAHELGHISGCNHDTTIPRSIMNVDEGAGLEYEVAEWSPEHVEILEKRLRRVPAPRR